MVGYAATECPSVIFHSAMTRYVHNLPKYSIQRTCEISAERVSKHTARLVYCSSKPFFAHFSRHRPDPLTLRTAHSPAAPSKHLRNLLRFAGPPRTRHRPYGARATSPIRYAHARPRPRVHRVAGSQHGRRRRGREAGVRSQHVPSPSRGPVHVIRRCPRL